MLIYYIIMDYIPKEITSNCKEPLKIIILLTVYSCALYCFMRFVINKSNIGLNTSLMCLLFVFGILATSLVCHNYNEIAAYVFIFIMATIYICFLSGKINAYMLHTTQEHYQVLSI